MDKYKKLIETFKAALHTEVLPIVAAEVFAVNGDSCEVTIGDLKLSDVRLKATINGNGDKVLISPKVGSAVLIGSLTGDYKDLVVLKVDELEKLEYQQNGLVVKVDSTSGKLEISNSQTSLKDLFQQLVDLLKQFQVTTPSGPSAGLLPTTMQAVTQFEISFKQLLN